MLIMSDVPTKHSSFVLSFVSDVAVCAIKSSSAG